jgi:hypothetical protein
MRSVGKRLHDEGGKHPVNENDEEVFRRHARRLRVSRVPIHAIVLNDG